MGANPSGRTHGNRGPGMDRRTPGTAAGPQCEEETCRPSYPNANVGASLFPEHLHPLCCTA